MTEKQWERFFDAIEALTSGNMGPYKEVAALVRQKAEEYGQATNLEEFLSWFESDE